MLQAAYVLDMITLILLDENKLESSSLCSHLKIPVTISLSGTNILKHSQSMFFLQCGRPSMKTIKKKVKL
jgi:hypothetical protein